MTDEGVWTQLQEPTRNEKVAVITSSSVIAEARNRDSPRKVINIRNISDAAADIITVNIGFNQATSENGIVLKQNESFSDSSETGYSCHQGAITAICATANGELAIFER
jgi:hypothetical protein